MAANTEERDVLDMLMDPLRRDAGFRRLVKLFGGRLLAHITSVVGSSTDAEDILQTTLVKVYRGLDGFRQDSSLFTWMYRIATNEALSWMRQQKRRERHIQPLGEQQMYLVEQHSTTASPDGEVVLELLNKALEKLPPKQRAVFSLRYFEEKTYEDIAAITGTSVGALKASYHHAVKKIEAYIQQ